LEEFVPPRKKSVRSEVLVRRRRDGERPDIERAPNNKWRENGRRPFVYEDDSDCDYVRDNWIVSLGLYEPEWISRLTILFLNKARLKKKGFECSDKDQTVEAIEE
jgi:hypothetical protein